MKKKTTEEFIKQAKNVHGDIYDYSLVVYKNNKTKIKIICTEHGIFEQIPDNHITKKYGCSSCTKNKKRTTKNFIEKAKSIHGDRYDYSMVDYKTAHTKIKILCPQHGIFEQTPNKHLKQNCPTCSNKTTKSTERFIKEAKGIHSDKYDYSLVNYINSKSKIKILCPQHGIFEQTPDSHINKKSECPICKESKGEIEIRKILESNYIHFIRQKTFKGCKDKKLLKFDFYLPNQNICIEYDGIQHFKSIDFFGGENGLKLTKKRDNIKNEYCEKNNITLLRIKYNESIENKIKYLL